MGIRSHFRSQWVLKIGNQQLFSHLAVILSDRIFESHGIDIKQVKGLSHLGVVVDAQDELGLDLGEYCCHLYEVLQLQIMLVKGGFVVGRIQVEERPGAVVAFNKLLPGQIFDGYRGQAQVHLAKRLRIYRLSLSALSRRFWRYRHCKVKYPSGPSWQSGGYKSPVCRPAIPTT